MNFDVFNLLDSQDSDIDYYTSRLPGEPAEGVNDVHSHQTEPRELRGGLPCTSDRLLTTNSATVTRVLHAQKCWLSRLLAVPGAWPT